MTEQQNPGMPREDEPIAETPWPKYKSHKVVEALEISGTQSAPLPGDSSILDDVMVFFVDPNYPTMTLEAKIFTRYHPIPGDFLVRYEDGHISVSPRQAFLDGYTKVED